MSKVKHVKRGTVYKVIGEAKIQADIPLTDYDSVVVYQDEKDGHIWVRPKKEFEDGRFEAYYDCEK